MKRFSFNSVSMFAALTVIFASSAFAQAKTPLEILKEGPHTKREDIKDESLAALHLTLSIQGKSFLLESDGEWPKVCIDRLEFTDVTATKPNLDEKGMKTALDAVKTQSDLKAIATKYTPVVAFSGTEGIPTFAKCLSEAGAVKDIEKTKAKLTPKSNKEIDDTEIAYISTAKFDDKTGESLTDKNLSARYLKYSDQVKRASCKDCNKTEPAKNEPLKDLELPALAQNGAEELLKNAIKSVVDAKTENTLDAAIEKLLALPEEIENNKALDLEYKKEFNQDVHDFAKKHGSKKIEELGSTTCSKNSFESQLALFSKAPGETKNSDYWSSFSFRKKSDDVKKSDESCASAFVKRQADLLTSISKFKYIDSDMAEQDKEIAEQILEAGNVHRIEQLSKMDDSDVEVTKAIFAAQQNYRRVGNQIAPQCSQLHNDDYANCVNSQLSMQCSNINNYAQYARCVTTTKQFNYYGSFRAFDTRSQLMSAQNSLVTGPFGMTYQTVNGGTTNSSAFSLNPGVFPNASQWNTSSGLSNQNTAFSPNLMYQNSSQWNRMQPNDPRANSTLPVAIPLNAFGNPSMQFGQHQFQNMS